MRCNKCGREIPNDTNFCSHCGNTVGSSWGTTNLPRAAEPKRKTNEIAVVLVVLVVVVVVIAGIYIAATAAREAARDITTASVNLTVLSSAAPNDYVFPPETGSKYVELTVIFVNKEDSSLSLSSFEFKIEVAGGARYASTWNVDDTVPASIAPGGSATFTIAFEIPSGAVPQKLIYDPLFENEVEASVP
jgi:hypothetical protein